MLKAAIKHGAGGDKVRHRVVPSEAVSKWSDRLNEMKEEIAEIMQEEKEEKHVSLLRPASDLGSISDLNCVSSVKPRWS